VTLERSDLHPAEALAERQRFCGNGIESYKKLRSLEQLVDNELCNRESAEDVKGFNSSCAETAIVEKCNF
jgi:hypothetical protein